MFMCWIMIYFKIKSLRCLTTKLSCFLNISHLHLIACISSPFEQIFTRWLEQWHVILSFLFWEVWNTIIVWILLRPKVSPLIQIAQSILKRNLFKSEIIFKLPDMVISNSVIIILPLFYPWLCHNLQYVSD